MGDKNKDKNNDKNNESAVLTEEQKKQLSDALTEQMDRMGEIFSQCWESDEFKQAFIKDPKAIFKEYGVNHASDKEYVIIDSPEKTLINVLPYEGIKGAIDGFTENFKNRVKDLDDKEGKQIILDGWKFVTYQNTPNKFYIVIPHCPEDLSPEELEMVNGGCFILVAEFLIFATSVAVGLEVAALAAVAAVVFEAAAAATTLAAMAEVFAVLLTVDVLATANAAFSGYFLTSTMFNESSINVAVVAPGGSNKSVSR